MSKLSLILLPLILTYQRSQAIDFPPDFLTSVDSIASAMRECYKIPALSVSIVDYRENASDPKLLARSYGVRSVRTNEPATSKTKFSVGSISKSMTAAAFAKLIGDGETFSYDTTLKELLPTRFSLDPQVSEYANLRDLLSHRTGLEAYDGALLGGTRVNRKDLLEATGDWKRNTGFRESFSYNNNLYALAGALLQLKMGNTRRFERLIEEMVFDELEMEAKFMTEMDEMSEDMAMPHIGVPKGNDSFQAEEVSFERLKASMGVDGLFNPTGGVMASAEDMLKYISFLSGDGAPLYGSAARVELARPQASVGGVEMVKQAEHGYLHAVNFYTPLGLWSGTHRGYRTMGHNGELPPYFAWLGVIPAPTRMGVYVASNGPGGVIGRAAMLNFEQAIWELLFTGNLSEWTPASVCIPIPIAQITPPPIPTDQTLPTIANAERYEGTYAHPLIGQVTIQRDNERRQLRGRLGTSAEMQLTLDDEKDQLKFDIQLIGESEFLVRGIGLGPVREEDRPKMQFVEDENGGIQGLRISMMLRGRSVKMEKQPVFQRVD